MKRISVIISYLCGLVVLSALPGTATSLTGSVVDPSGKIVEHATVQLTRAANASITTAISDRNGQYVFQNVGAGDYLLSASAGALSAPEPLTVKVSEDADQAITIHLEITATRNQVTVTAAALPQSFDLVSKALDVVNTDEAERRGVFTLADALQEVPGLRVVSRGGPGAFTTIQTRGLRTADTSILVDGFRFRDITGTQGDASSFIGDLFLVDSSRIEVLRGSGSSLYGTNSIAGTINVITDQGGGPVHGDLDFQSGGLGVNRGLAHVGGGSPDGRLFYSGGLAYLNELSGVNGGGPARNWSGQGGATYVLTPTLRIGGRLLADTHYLQLTTSPYPVFGSSSDPIVSAVAPSSTQLSLANAGQPFSVAGATFVPNLNDPDARINSRFLSGLIHLDNQLTPRFSWRVSMQSESTHRNNINGPLGAVDSFQPLTRTSDVYDGRVDTLQARADYIAAPWQLITAGYEWEREQFGNIATDRNPDPLQRTYSYVNAKQRSNAVFAQDQLQLFHGRLLVLLSARYTNLELDRPRFYGGEAPYSQARIASPHDAYTGDASIAYFVRKTNTKFRAHAGNAFRQPSLYERFGTGYFNGIFTPYGDPRLSPDRAVSGDAGIDQMLWGERIRLSGTFFYTRLQQVISFDTLGIITPVTDPFGRFGGYFNTGGGLSRGVEVSAQLRPTRKTFIQAAYTYTNSVDRTSEFSTGTGSDPIQRPRILPHTVTLRATQQLTRNFEIGADFLGGSNFLFPLYGLAYRFDGPRQLGLSANYTVPISDRVNLRFYTRVSNTLDQKYFEDAFQTPGRWAVGGFRVSF